MADRFENWTERARQTLVFAEEEARGFNHNYIGTEHQLLGLIRVDEGVAAKVLVALGVELGAVRSRVEQIIGRGDRPMHGQIGLTPRAKKVVELALDEGKRLNHHYVGTEHLLLGLVREGEGVAAGVLESLGVSLEQVRPAILKILFDGPPPELPKDPKEMGRLVMQWMERERSLKRYNLALPEDLYADVQALADRQHTTVVELLRRFIKLGLLATEIQERPDASLLIREGDREREILLL